MNREALAPRLSWWTDHQYNIDPMFAYMLSDEEIDLVAEWFKETTNIPYIGEGGMPILSFLSSLIVTNNIRHVVQLGHYAGQGSLILGMILRKMGSNARLISFDISDEMTAYCETWMQRAGLQDYVRHVTVSSIDPITVDLAHAFLGEMPGVVFIDASKQYGNTLRELDMWTKVVTGYIVCHDVSDVAKANDSNSSLGVGDALRVSDKFPAHELVVLDPVKAGAINLPYSDPCGVGFGLSRGTPPEKPTESFEDLARRIAVTPRDILNQADNWFLGQGFTVSDGKLSKVAGKDSFASVLAPIKEGQTVRCRIKLSELTGNGAMVCGGGGKGTSFWFKGNGEAEGTFVVGGENCFVAVFGPADASFVVESIAFERI